MGEQEYLSSANSNPVYIVIMRNSRGKLFVYVAVLGVLCFIVFLLSSTHTSLKELESVNEKCQQQRDSLSAQLQVVYEHKNRLEKSLQQEKTNHRHTKEENEKQIHQTQSKLQEEKEKTQKLETQVTQLKASYSELEEEKTQSENALTEQLKTVQAQKDKEIEKLQNHISELLTEKDKLEMSNNDKIWKIEQQTSEVKFCHLQHDQSKKELAKCQAQFQKNLQNTEDNNLVPNSVTTSKKAENDIAVKLGNENPEPQVQADLKVAEVKEHSDNKSTVEPRNEKKVFSKPHILPFNNNAADGVLPKPVDEKVEDVDAAVEVPEVKKGEQGAKLIHINQRDTDNKINLLHDDNKENIDNVIKSDLAQKDLENHPQMLPPNNFDIGEKDDHAAERGEYGPQYGLPDARQQVEIPVFNNKHNAKRKGIMPQQVNNDIAAQMQDMMNKSPGDVNNFEDQNGLHMPPEVFGGAIDNKIREFKNADGLIHRAGDANNVMDDKNYEEDDDDRENDDEQLNGAVPEIKGVQGVLQDNDFDDQENQENVDNAKEEGVVVAPK